MEWQIAEAFVQCPSRTSPRHPRRAKDGIHLGIAGTTLRDSAIAALGEGAYRAVSRRARRQ
jgi:hypothetical protein